MPLPKIETKFHTCILPTNGKEVKYRPFKMKEQKGVMLVTETQSELDSYSAIVDMIQECVENVDVKTLCSVDFEYLFFNVKAVSKGSLVPVVYKCQKCKQKNEIRVNVITELAPSNQNYALQVDLDDDMTVHFKLPSFLDAMNIFELIEDESVNPDDEEQQFGINVKDFYNMIASCIYKVEHKDQVFADFTVDEAVAFFEDIPEEKSESIVDFFNDMPEMKYVGNHKCFDEKCGSKLELSTKDVKSFL